MQPTTPDLSQTLLSILAQFAPYLVSGATLSHVIAQWQIIDKPETPDWLKIAIAFVVALIGTALSNVLTGGYADGNTFGVYAAATLHQAGLLFGTMTLANVSTDKFIPSFAQWSADTLTRLIVAVRKGVDTLLNRGEAPAANTPAA